MAVGAIVGIVDRFFNAVLRTDDNQGFILHTEESRDVFKSMGEAVAYGRKKLKSLARERMKQDHVVDPLFEFSIEEKKFKSQSGEEFHLESVLRLRATGKHNVWHQQ